MTYSHTDERKGEIGGHSRVCRDLNFDRCLIFLTHTAIAEFLRKRSWRANTHEKIVYQLPFASMVFFSFFPTHNQHPFLSRKTISLFLYHR
jgi:hypothetical protein